jgi:8-oxo-dGTP diphosphatase
LPTGDEIITDLAEAPSLALEQPSDAIEPEPPLSMLQRLRRWLRGTTRS